jgi:hypothetical protein
MRFVNHFSPDGTYAETGRDPLGGDLSAGSGTPWKPGFVGGYHAFWDALEDFLDGVPKGSRLPPTEMSAIVDHWAVQTHFLDYGLTAAQRDRIVRGLRGAERWNELNKVYREHIKATFPAEAG